MDFASDALVLWLFLFFKVELAEGLLSSKADPLVQYDSLRDSLSLLLCGDHLIVRAV